MALQARQAPTLLSSFILGMVALIIFLITTDVFAIFFGFGANAARAQLALMIPLLLFVVLYYRHVFRGAAAAPELAILTSLCTLSFFWSYEPFTTLERSFPLLITTALSMALASIFSLRKLIILFAIVGMISMCASLFAIATVPEARGIPPWENTWNGVYNHKNGLGAGSVMALIFSVCAMLVTEGSGRRFFGACALLAMFMLVASESRSPQVFALISLGALAGYLVSSRFALIWAIGYLSFVVIVLAAISYLLITDILDPVFEAMGRKPTLSGRLPLWDLLGAYIYDEFWFGYGYRGFWHPDTVRVQELSGKLQLGFVPFYSHNGIVETWLHLGLLGFVVLVAALVRIGWACSVLLRYLEERSGIVAIVLTMAMFVMMNTTEGSILSRMSLTWMMFVAFATKASLLATIVAKQSVHLRIFNAEADESRRHVAAVGG